MGVRLSSQEDVVCMFCSVTEQAFGPVFHDTDDTTAEEIAEKFLEWYSARAQGNDGRGDIRADWFWGAAGRVFVMQRYREWHEAVFTPEGEFNRGVADSLIRKWTTDDVRETSTGYVLSDEAAQAVIEASE